MVYSFVQYPLILKCKRLRVMVGRRRAKTEEPVRVDKKAIICFSENFFVLLGQECVSWLRTPRSTLKKVRGSLDGKLFSMYAIL